MHCSFAVVVVLLKGSKQCPSFAGEIDFSERLACCPGGLRLMDFHPTLHFFVSAKLMPQHVWGLALDTFAEF